VVASGGSKRGGGVAGTEFSWADIVAAARRAHGVAIDVHGRPVLADARLRP
jgi:hypothetical protein